MSESLFTRRTLLSAATGAAALAALGACAGSSTGPSAPATPGATGATASLDAVFEKAFEASGMAGVAARVRLPGGGLWQKALGFGDLQAKTPYDPADFVRIASITKTFTATAVLTMVDDGMIALTDTLDRWYPGIPNASAITLEQMLGMRSGIFDFTSEQRFDDLFDASPTMEWSIEQTVDVILRNQPAFAPGAQVSYCDSNYALLGAIAARVDGSPLGNVIQARVIAPAGLRDTYYPADAGIRSPHPQGYVPTVENDGSFDTSAVPRIVNEVNPAVAAGAGALVSTLDDVSAWGDVLVDGTLLTPATQAARLATQKFEGQKLNFGYGLGITNFNEYLGHDGAIFGFSSVVLTRPSTKTQIAIVGNESTNSTTPTLTMAVAIINEIDPSQGTNAG